MKYTVVGGNGITELIQEVNELIAKGWRPQGGVATFYDTRVMYQAMIRD